MSRRTKISPMLDGVPPLVGLVVLGFLMVPWFRILVVWAGIALVASLIGFIIYRFANQRTPNESRQVDPPYVSKLAVVTTSVKNESTSPLAYLTSPAPPCSRKQFEGYSGDLSAMLRQIDWFQFEKLISVIYQDKGYQVKRIGGARPDGGVDLLIERGGTKTVVQCKHWKSWVVGVRNIREFLGTLTDQQISTGIFVTIRGYTNEAKDLAAKHGIVLLDQADLSKLMEDVNWRFNPAIQSVLSDERKWCPKCERELVLRVARRGKNAGNQFWGCSGYPRCKFILSIS